MIRDHFFTAKRGSWVRSDSVEILSVSMGSLRLITPSQQAHQRRKIVSIAAGMGLSAVFAFIPIVFRFTFRSGYVVILYSLIVAVIGIVTIIIVERWAVRFLTRHLEGQLDLKVREVYLRRFLHDLQVVAGGKEFLLKVQGFRRNVMDALSLAGFPLPLVHVPQ